MALLTISGVLTGLQGLGFPPHSAGQQIHGENDGAGAGAIRALHQFARVRRVVGWVKLKPERGLTIIHQGLETDIGQGRNHLQGIATAGGFGAGPLRLMVKGSLA